MKEQITLDLIKNFSNTYNSNSVNRIIENAITENGLEKSCIDRRIIEENQPVFNTHIGHGGQKAPMPVPSFRESRQMCALN